MIKTEQEVEVRQGRRQPSASRTTKSVRWSWKKGERGVCPPDWPDRVNKSWEPPRGCEPPGGLRVTFSVTGEKKHLPPAAQFKIASLVILSSKSSTHPPFPTAHPSVPLSTLGPGNAASPQPLPQSHWCRHPLLLSRGPAPSSTLGLPGKLVRTLPVSPATYTHEKHR